MARYHYVIGILILLLAGCAQMGTISGGEKDTSAPKPIEEDVSPLNASTFFTSKQIEIPFDEFFSLNDPNQKIQIVPPHAKIQSQVKGKTLFLNWEEDLEANTTYAIYLNRAVKDLSEGNDSIMQYVFSTGSTLDSLSYFVSVVDAWTNLAMKNVLVGLYNPEDGTILNFAQTDLSGRANLRYLKSREYSLIAFEDENGDLIAQPDEAIGFFDDSLIHLDSSFISPNAFRMYKPLVEAEIVSAKFQAPSNFLIEINRPIENEEIYLDGVLISEEKYTVITQNTLALYVDASKLVSGSGEIIYKDGLFVDTASYRVLDAQKKGDVVIKPDRNGTFAPSDSITLLINDLITTVNSEFISIQNLEDSSEVTPFTSYTKNKLQFILERGKTRSYIIRFEVGAIETVNGLSQAFETTILLNSSKKYGSFSIDVSHYTTPFILQILRGENSVIELELEPTSERVIIGELRSGSYTFKVIHDENQNGRWDVGDLKTRQQPERVDIYSSPSKIRANWEVEVQLIPKTETP